MPCRENSGYRNKTYAATIAARAEKPAALFLLIASPLEFNFLEYLFFYRNHSVVS